MNAALKQLCSSNPEAPPCSARSNWSVHSVSGASRRDSSGAGGMGGKGGGPGGGGEDGDAAVVAPPPGRTRTTPTMAACGESTHKHRAHMLRHDECSRHMMRWGRRAWAAATHNSSDTKNADHDDDDFHVARAFDGHRLFLLGLNLHRGRHIGEWKSKMRQLRRRRGVVTIDRSRRAV